MQKTVHVQLQEKAYCVKQDALVPAKCLTQCEECIHNVAKEATVEVACLWHDGTDRTKAFDSPSELVRLARIRKVQTNSRVVIAVGVSNENTISSNSRG